MIRLRGEGPVDGVEYRGAERAAPAPEALAAIAAAEAIVIGPSNPIVSIGPILALPGMAGALREAPAPVVAVSPIVGGEVLKGPTAAFMRHAGHECSAAGVAAAYAGVIDGLIADEELAAGAGALHTRRTETLMDGPDARVALARATVSFALGMRTRDS